nr:hypothetical protein [uncultured bacterium]
MDLRVAVLTGCLIGGLTSASALASGPAAPCKTVEFQTDPFTVCAFPATADVRLFWGEGAQPYKNFGAVSQALSGKQERLVFAMNAGMYHKDRAPVGLYVDTKGQRGNLQTKASYGNFGLVPNGVFHVSASGMAVTETNAFKAQKLSPDYATQSGPMLVIDNQLHPKFMSGSTSKRIRNGVGVSGDGQTVYFVLSDRPVNFYKFGSLFKDKLETPNALYLDGTISRLFDAASGRNDLGAPMGPILGVVTMNEADKKERAQQ